MIKTTDLIDQISSLHEALVASSQTAVTHAIRVGDLLIQLKKSLKHGEFRRACEHLPFEKSTAASYMKLAEWAKANVQHVGHLKLPLRQLLASLAKGGEPDKLHADGEVAGDQAEASLLPAVTLDNEAAPEPPTFFKWHPGDGRLKKSPVTHGNSVMTNGQFERLVESIGNRGLLQLGIMYDGMVLDGWHRYLACAKVGVEFMAVNFYGTPAEAREFFERIRDSAPSVEAPVRTGASDWLIINGYKLLTEDYVQSQLEAPADDYEKVAIASDPSITLRSLRLAHMVLETGLDRTIVNQVTALEALVIADLPPDKQQLAYYAARNALPFAERFIDGSDDLPDFQPKVVRPFMRGLLHPKIPEE